MRNELLSAVVALWISWWLANSTLTLNSTISSLMENLENLESHFWADILGQWACPGCPWSTYSTLFTRGGSHVAFRCHYCGASMWNYPLYCIVLYSLYCIVLNFSHWSHYLELASVFCALAWDNFWVQSNMLKWIALGPDCEYPFMHSVHVFMFYTLHCV